MPPKTALQPCFTAFAKQPAVAQRSGTATFMNAQGQLVTGQLVTQVLSLESITGLALTVSSIL